MKIFIFKLKHIFIFILVIIFLLSVIAYNAYAIKVNAEPRELPIYSVARDDKVVSLTFDVAWDDKDVPEIIAILDKYDVKASFFIVGDWLDKYPESAKSLADAGHEILNHSDTHAHPNKLTQEQIIEDVKKCDEKIHALTGQKHNLYRPPYGEYNNNVIIGAKKAGDLTIQWDVDSLDWKDPPVEKIVSNVLDKVKSGSIILLHVGAKNTPFALPMIVEGLLKSYTIEPVSKIIYYDNYIIDHAGVQLIEH